MAAHEAGKLHEAFSIFVFNSKGEVLLQKRAAHKYHSGGLWTNTCCGHARFGEDLPVAAKRRLNEEMGITCELRELFSFIYKVNLPNGLIEHELDHVFTALYDAEPLINPEEAEDYAWVKIADFLRDIAERPERYTYWLKEIVKHTEFLKYLEETAL